VGGVYLLDLLGSPSPEQAAEVLAHGEPGPLVGGSHQVVEQGLVVLGEQDFEPPELRELRYWR
jgi:hypothetical protein